MTIKILDEKAARKLLQEQQFGHLGCPLPGGEPDIVPINYLFYEEEIYVCVINRVRKNRQSQVIKDEEINLQSRVLVGSHSIFSQRWIQY